MFSTSDLHHLSPLLLPRDLQEEVEQLRRRRQGEELKLREVEETLSDRRRDLAGVSADLDSATDRCSLSVRNILNESRHIQFLLLPSSGRRGY